MSEITPVIAKIGVELTDDAFIAEFNSIESDSASCDQRYGALFQLSIDQGWSPKRIVKLTHWSYRRIYQMQQYWWFFRFCTTVQNWNPPPDFTERKFRAWWALARIKSKGKEVARFRWIQQQLEDGKSPADFAPPKSKPKPKARPISEADRLALGRLLRKAKKLCRNPDYRYSPGVVLAVFEEIEPIIAKITKNAHEKSD